MASKLDEKDKNEFIEILTSMSETEINQYIKDNGKNNSKESLFVFNWDRLKEDYNKNKK